MGRVDRCAGYSCKNDRRFKDKYVMKPQFFVQVVVFVVLELTFLLWYLSVAAVCRFIYSLTIAKPVSMLAIRYTMESLPVS